MREYKYTDEQLAKLLYKYLAHTQKKNMYDKNIFLAGFLLIMLTEWGDKTQIASALFATNYNPYLLLVGTIIALSLLSIVAIFFGKIISEKINEKIIIKVGGIIFILLGIFFFL